jgi:hypothetical protein
MIDRASRLQLEDPAASGTLWAEIDRKIVRQAPFLWLVNVTAIGFVSERVGNYQFHYQWGAAQSALGPVAGTGRQPPLSNIFRTRLGGFAAEVMPPTPE